MDSRPLETVDIPPYHQMLWPTLQAVIDLGDSGTIQEIDDKAIELAGYTESQQAVLHNDGPKTEIRYRMAWARSYLKAVGALTNSARGVWAIAEYGHTLTEPDMETIPPKVRALWQESRNQNRKGRNRRSQADQSAPDSSPAVVPGNPYSSTDPERWRDTLLELLQGISPDGFERLCQRFLRESGFTQVTITGRSGDGGIDGIGVLRIALLSFQVFFQCKRYKGSVGAAAIRDFRGAMVGRTDKGILITTGSFTSEAKREATRDGAPVLDLIDGETLCTILKDLKLGVNTQLVEEITINPEWFQGL